MSKRIETLLDALTREEKISLLAGADAWTSVPNARLGIPSIKVSDGPNGVRGASRNGRPTSACFPAGIALGATWNVDLVEQIGQALAEESKSKGVHILLAPTVNMHRSPLAGRNFECYSEDPLLTGRIAIAYISGLQSRGVGACIKHFACNESEFERFSMSSEVGERALREIYLRPFEMAVREAQPWSLMTAYNRVNGVHASEHDHLLLEILKGEWGFDGLVMSDWYGTYSEGAIASGLDLEMPGPARWFSRERVQAALESGRVGQAQIDDKVRRLLRTVERVGAFAQPTLEPERAEDRPEHRALIRRTAVEATVLLKNQGAVLPLDLSALERIAIIGANARQPAALAAIMGGGSAAVSPHYVVSPLEGIRQRVDDQAVVDYAVGCDLHRRLPAIDGRWLRVPDGSERGALLEYFAADQVAGEPAAAEVIDTLQASWFGDFVPGVPAQRFCARLSAQLMVPETASYRLGLASVGLSRLYLDGDLLLDRWSDKEPLDWAEDSRLLELEAGRGYDLRVEYCWAAAGNWRGLQVGLVQEVTTDLMAEAERAAGMADVAIVFAGLNAEWEGEGSDRASMSLPRDQDALIQQVAAANANTIVVLNGGGPVAMPWLDQVAAVLLTWYPGQEAGNAITDVLFGDADPSGRLPASWPRKLRDNPSYLNYPGEHGKVLYGEGVFIGYRYYEKKGIEPLFPFGFGLSYTTFSYDNLRLDASTYAPGEKILVSVDVTNTGIRAGQEVVQLYVSPEAPAGSDAQVLRPEKELAAFAKLHLEAGETRTVQFALNQQVLAHYDTAWQGWVVEPGAYQVLIARSAADCRLQIRFAVV